MLYESVAIAELLMKLLIPFVSCINSHLVSHPLPRAEWKETTPVHPHTLYGKLSHTLYSKLSHTLYGKLSHTLYGKLSHTLYGKLSHALYGKLSHTLYGKLWVQLCYSCSR